MKEKKITKETVINILVFFSSVIIALVFYFHPEILADSDGKLPFSHLTMAYLSGVFSLSAVIIAYFMIKDVILYMKYYEKINKSSAT